MAPAPPDPGGEMGTPGTPLPKALPQIGLKPKYSCKK